MKNDSISAGMLVLIDLWHKLDLENYQDQAGKQLASRWGKEKWDQGKRILLSIRTTEIPIGQNPFTCNKAPTVNWMFRAHRLPKPYIFRRLAMNFGIWSAGIEGNNVQ